MNGASSASPGLWELAVLALLREAPMHPYQLQRTLTDRHKAELLALKKGSLYHAIHRLERANLIEQAGTARNGKRPERTTYRITPQGEREQVRWLRNLIAQPATEPSDFMASLSFLVYLQPDEAIAQLDERARILTTQIAELTNLIATLRTRLPRIHVIENEYVRAMRKAELAWIQHLLRDLRSGEFHWDTAAILDALKIHHVVENKDSK